MMVSYVNIIIMSLQQCVLCVYVFLCVFVCVHMQKIYLQIVSLLV